ncbi:MAG: hypothetical protein JHC28_01775 [Thermoprotei archaeon]|jgi:thioredoxin-related protein|nr:hypothetical protein [Thermoprotei archaeon]
MSATEACDRFKEPSLSELKNLLKERGWLYCLTCKKTIVDEEELEKHFMKHIIIGEILIDDAVFEEAHAGD